MRQYVCVTVIALVALMSWASTSYSWSTRGGSPDRKNVVTISTGLLNDETTEQQAFPVGQSATQPLIWDDGIHVISGTGLYLVDFGKEPGFTLRSRTNRYVDQQQIFVSSSTPTASAVSGRLYGGTAFGLVWSVDQDNAVLDRWIYKGCAIVSSPLLLSVYDRALARNREVAIVGHRPNGTCTVPGQVHVVWGLDGVGEIGHASSSDLGGWITASPVAGFRPNEFIIAADGMNCGGAIAKYQVRSTGVPSSPFEVERIKDGGYSDICVPHGVPDGFAVHDNYVYWVDKEGYLSGRHLDTGLKPPNWETERIDLLQNGLTRGRAFTNMVPAIDPVNDKVYVTLRNYNPHGTPSGPSPNRCPNSALECTGYPGAYVAVKLSTGKVEWARAMDYEPDQTIWKSINTNPVILQSQDAIMFGDVNGEVHLVNGKDGTILRSIKLLKAGERPMRATESWHQVSGAGTEPMVAMIDGREVFFMGVNYRDGSGRPDWAQGRLVAMAMSGYYNLFWDGELTVAPLDPSKPNENLVLRGRVAMNNNTISLDQLGPVTVQWWLLDMNFKPLQSAPIDTQQITSLGEVQSRPFNLDVPGQQFKVLAVIHPGGITQQHSGSNQEKFLSEMPGVQKVYAGPSWIRELATLNGVDLLEDNLKYAHYNRSEETGNLKLTVSAPGHAGCTPTSYQVTYSVTNEGSQAVTVRVRGHVSTGKGPDWSLGNRSVTIGAGQTVTGTFSVNTLYPDDASKVTVWLNESRAVAETDWSDNEVTVWTAIGETCGTGVAPRPTGGGRATIIVPSDCRVNPDPSSAYPCLNYPDLRIP